MNYLIELFPNRFVTWMDSTLFTIHSNEIDEEWNYHYYFLELNSND